MKHFCANYGLLFPSGIGEKHKPAVKVKIRAKLETSCITHGNALGFKKKNTHDIYHALCLHTDKPGSTITTAEKEPT